MPSNDIECEPSVLDGGCRIGLWDEVIDCVAEMPFRKPRKKDHVNICTSETTTLLQLFSTYYKLTVSSISRHKLFVVGFGLGLRINTSAARFLHPSRMSFGRKHSSCKAPDF